MGFPFSITRTFRRSVQIPPFESDEHILDYLEAAVRRTHADKIRRTATDITFRPFVLGGWTAFRGTDEVQIGLSWSREELVVVYWLSFRISAAFCLILVFLFMVSSVLSEESISFPMLVSVGAIIFGWLYGMNYMISQRGATMWIEKHVVAALDEVQAASSETD